MNTLLLTALLPFCAADGTMPPPPPAPLLFVRVVGPDGLLVTVRPGSPEARTMPAPACAGYRPGYGYRLALGNLPGEPGRFLYPSLEVLDTLHVPPTLKAEDFPATVTVTADDLRAAASGGLVTKVIYLEDPFQAPAMTSTCEQPVELDVLAGHDPLEEARVRGRAMAIFRLGAKDITPQELAMCFVPGTVLAPGDAGLPAPACPPTLPRALFPWFDPVLGPKKPLEEILPDGGDVGPRVGIGPDGKIGGLDVTDTAAEYRYGRNPRRVTISNRVCLFSPRFAILRAVYLPAGEDVVIGPQLTGTALAQAVLFNREVTDLRWTALAARGFHSKLGVRGIQSRIGVAAVDRVEGVAAVGMVEGLASVGTVVEAEDATQVLNCCKPDQPLVVMKYAEPKAPKVGEVVTFVLTYENYGAKPIRDVVIADSLASRLEYIPGSAQADRAVVFTVGVNEVYSALLRWEVKGDLMPGQRGAVRFQARVR